MIDFGFDGLDSLVIDLETAGPRALAASRDVTRKAASDLMDRWRVNARATSGKHGRHYPGSITAEARVELGAISYEVGPEVGRRQGGMGRGFEFGSVNQPPHLNGTKAADSVEPGFVAAMTFAAEGLL